MSEALKSVIVGTAGHIDHGKSALVEVLTGTHPDRLAEEKRRGITIDLGFAFLEEQGVRFGFVDVPGHERFISNMLAGAAGIDVVLLIIAADEGVKPQTREHFDICKLLGVKDGVIALTKSDLVDDSTRAVAQLEIEDYVRGSFLEGAAIVPVSAKTGSGIIQLRQALQASALRVPGKDSTRAFRLPIDRAFAMKGFGSVVTGTLISGSVAAGDEVELLPRGEKLRVRGVQSGGRAIERALAGQRTAVNLAGIEHTALRRGMSLAAPGKFRTTRRIDAQFTLLSGAPRLKNRERVHLHASTAETIAELSFYGKSEIAPGESAMAHLQLREEIPMAAGDRFIVRQFSPVTTIGGGLVLDPLARRPMARDTGRTKFLEIIRAGSRVEILAAMVGRAPLGLRRTDTTFHTGWSEQEIRATEDSLAGAGRIKSTGEDGALLVERQVFETVRNRLYESVDRFQKQNPLVPGIAREELRATLGRRVRPEIFRAAIAELTAEKKIEVQGELVRRAGASVRLQPEEQVAREKIEAAFKNAGLAVPSVKEVLANLSVDARRAEKILQILLRDKTLARISPELIFHHAALLQLKEKLGAYKKSKSERISVPVFKDLTGVTRKYAIPLLEYLDRERVTRRAGDERVIL
jgi:selenocysteine-specific elongation factor